MKMFLIGLLAGLGLAFILLFIAISIIGQRIEKDDKTYPDE